MKFTLSCIIVFLSLSFTYGQGQTYSKRISGTVSISGGSYSYTTDIKFRIKNSNYGNSPTALQVGFANSKITSITYNGKSGVDLLTDINFPVAAKIQANLKGKVILKSNSGPNQVDINFNEPYVSDGGLDDFNFSTVVINRIKQTFGEDVKYNDLTPALTGVSIDGFSVGIIHDLTNKMSKKIRQLKEEKRIREKEEERKNAIAQEKIKKDQESQENSSDSYDYSENSDYTYSSRQNTTNSSGISSESIYQQKQREAAKVRAAQQSARQAAQKRANAQYEENQRKLNNLNQTTDNIKNTINQFADQYNARIKAEAAERKARAEAYERRKAAEEAERREKRRLRNITMERERKERAEKERINDAQFSFLNSIKDNKIAVAANKKELFFIIITKSFNDNKIEIAPFSLIANSENLLPYKIDIISDYKKKTGRSNAYIQGPYNTFDVQRNAVNSFQENALKKYVSSRIIKYSYSNKYSNTASGNKDFWGNSSEKSKPTKTNSKDTDFWGEKKTNSKQKTKTTNSTIWD